MNVAITMSLPQPPRAPISGISGLVVTAAYSLVIATLAGALGGAAIDRAVGAGHLWTLMLGAMGIVVGFFITWSLRKPPSAGGAA